MDAKMEMRNSVAENRERMNKMTQKELGERTGVTQRAISYIENNKRIPSVLLAMRISQILNVDIYDLFIDLAWEKEKQRGIRE